MSEALFADQFLCKSRIYMYTSGGFKSLTIFYTWMILYDPLFQTDPENQTITFPGTPTPYLCVKMSRCPAKGTSCMCAQWRLRSACASAQSDQSLRRALYWLQRIYPFFTQKTKTLIRLFGCTADWNLRCTHIPTCCIPAQLAWSANGNKHVSWPS